MSLPPDTIQARLRHFRERVLGTSLRELQQAVNQQLPESQGFSLGTVSNYERPPVDGRPRAAPRADFLAALQRAYPELRLPWLLLGEGEPTALGRRVTEVVGAQRDGGEAAGSAPGRGGAGGSEGGLSERVLRAHPDLELLSPEASALFIGALTRYATGEPRMDLDEEMILELASDLRWLLFLPFRLWGFEPRRGYEGFSGYCVAALHALAMAMPSPGEGHPAAAYPEAPNRRLRESLEVGFSGR